LNGGERREKDWLEKKVAFQSKAISHPKNTRRTFAPPTEFLVLLCGVPPAAEMRTGRNET
jgi:hypothetical protein